MVIFSLHVYLQNYSLGTYFVSLFIQKHIRLLSWWYGSSQKKKKTQTKTSPKALQNTTVLFDRPMVQP